MVGGVLGLEGWGSVGAGGLGECWDWRVGGGLGLGVWEECWGVWGMSAPLPLCPSAPLPLCHGL